MAQLAALEAAVVFDEILSLRGCQLREMSPVVGVAVVVAAPLVLVAVGARASLVVGRLVLVPLRVVVLSVDLLGDSVDEDLGEGDVIEVHRVWVGWVKVGAVAIFWADCEVVADLGLVVELGLNS